MGGGVWLRCHYLSAHPFCVVIVAFSLLLAFVAAVPVNRGLLSKGRGHALVHQYDHAHSC